MNVKYLLILTCIFSTSIVIADSSSVDSNDEKIDYYSCLIKEADGDVTVKFAVKNVNYFKETATLVQYPGLGEEDPYLSVIPTQFENGSFSFMSNLNSQGGDLRVEYPNLRLFGDGDGLQFTDLVIWNANEDTDELEGYVREYGPVYYGMDTFKQFIKCKRAQEVI